MTHGTLEFVDAVGMLRNYKIANYSKAETNSPLTIFAKLLLPCKK